MHALSSWTGRYRQLHLLCRIVTDCHQNITRSEENGCPEPVQGLTRAARRWRAAGRWYGTRGGSGKFQCQSVCFKGRCIDRRGLAEAARCKPNPCSTRGDAFQRDGTASTRQLLSTPSRQGQCSHHPTHPLDRPWLACRHIPIFLLRSLHANAGRITLPARDR